MSIDKLTGMSEVGIPILVIIKCNNSRFLFLRERVRRFETGISMNKRRISFFLIFLNKAVDMEKRAANLESSSFLIAVFFN